MRCAIPSLVAILAVSSTRDDDKLAEFGQHTFVWHGGAKMPYRLLEPAKIEAGQKYPLVLVLHGWGERGTDNQKQLKDFGPAFLKPDVRKKFACFVLIPQANGSWVQHPVFDKPIRLTNAPAANLAMANEIVKGILKKHPVDATRLYLTGFSNGACGVWELLEREPGVWAAAAPMAGAGDPSADRCREACPHLGFSRREGHDHTAGANDRDGRRPTGRRRASEAHEVSQRRSLRRQEGPPRSEPAAVDVRAAPGQPRSSVRQDRRAERQASDES